MQPHPLHKTMRSSFRPVFTSKPVQIRSTPKAITPFGGLVSLIEFFNKIGLASKLQEAMPFTLTSPNAIPPAHTLMAFLSSVIAGAKRFAHTDWLRFDKAFHVMLGIERFPGTDTVRNLFARFTQGTIEAFWRPLWRWLLPLFEHPPEGFSLDLDLLYSNEAASRKGPQKDTTPSVRAAKRTIRFWLFWAKPNACSMRGCAAATRLPVAASPSFFRKHSRFCRLIGRFVV